jgi:uncharacterized protein (TIGR03067 family)
MKRLALLMGLVGLLGAADAPKDVLKQLEGTWVMVSGEEKGAALPEELLKTAQLTITGDKHTGRFGKSTIVGAHKLDPTKKPAEIDVMDTEGPFKGKPMLGIYKLEGDQLTACFSAPGKDRPKEFTTKSGTGEFVHVWKRAKK